MEKDRILGLWRARYLEELEACAAELEKREMPKLTEERFAMFEKNGNRLVYEDDYFMRRKYLAVFGCLAICGKKNRSKHIQILEQVIRKICAEECWALPAHVNRKEKEDWRTTVELFASETGQALAELSYYLKEELSEPVHRLIYDEVNRRVIKPYVSKQPYDWWEQSDMNWNAVCNGCIGMAAIYLLGEQKKLQSEILARVMENIRYFIKGFGDDGTCFEGLSYFTYGFGYYIGFLDLYARHENKPLYEFLSDQCRQIALFQQKCYFPSGLTVCFSDGFLHDRFQMGLTCRLMSLYGEVHMPAISSAASFDTNTCYRFLPILRDLLWTEEYLEITDDRRTRASNTGSMQAVVDGDADISADAKDGCIVLPRAQWGICHGRVGGMACKGGHNDEPHNHNDIGSFFYLLGDEMMLDDLGAGEYTKAYFSDGRYGILCNNSFGHNVPLINQKGQSAGSAYCCTRFLDMSTEYMGKFVLEIQDAYESAELKRLTRSISYEHSSGMLEVEDVFETEGCLVEENLVTHWQPEIKGNVVILRGNTHCCSVVVGNLSGEIRVLEETHQSHDGNAERVYRIVWTVADAGQRGTIRSLYRVALQPSEPLTEKGRINNG